MALLEVNNLCISFGGLRAVDLDGKDITGHKTMEINHDGIARTFQNIRLFHQMSILDNVKAALENQYQYSLLESLTHLGRYGKVEKEMTARAMDLLKVFGLDKEPDLLSSNLPYGQAGMNPNETKELMDTIELIRDKFGITILLIEHDMKLVSGICEKLTVLNFGRILAEGDTKTVLSNPEVVKAYLGDE